jgi:C1A family cysteine protease
MKKYLILVFSLFLISLPAVSQEPGTGLNFDDDKYKTVLKKAVLTRSLYSEVPAVFSLKKYAPNPKSQGQFGTCVGWSTAYAGMTILESIHKGRTDKTVITNNTFSPGFIYKQIKTNGDNDCKLGSSISDALDIMKTKGVCKYTDMTEKNCPTYISADIFLKASKYKIKDYAKIFGMFDSKEFKINAVKKSISQNNPVIIGMNTPSSFYKATGEWQPSESSSLVYGGHAMCVIGYDDNKYGGAFEIMNSWGDFWGNGGFIWISYDVFYEFVKYAYEMIEYKPTDNSVKTNNFGGRIKFVKQNGTESKAIYYDGIYKLNEPYKSGTLFRLYISNTKPSYVYAFGYDATEKTFTVFPHNEGISPALNYAQNSVAIPDEDHYIQTDNTVGKDYLCVIYSKNPLDIEKIKKKVENGSGSFYARVKLALSEKLVDPSNITFGQANISFDVKNSTKSVAALIIETDHIP